MVSVFLGAALTPPSRVSAQHQLLYPGPGQGQLPQDTLRSSNPGTAAQDRQAPRTVGREGKTPPRPQRALLSPWCWSVRSTWGPAGRGRVGVTSSREAQWCLPGLRRAHVDESCASWCPEPWLFA